ncbi:MAG: 2-oxoacid:ferredoxin oxidoreductase subunit gamma, partial [Thermoplasmata archaeon]|nr:2-oxoacid:ferredoxin oxidoreductase subunit gamma [Thermoplasmata archaeon]NIS14098.1 2-oxoacid:ferredoxin oxidoreductase subunit gamma [Thermoplasmata archaeon]NIS21941.1 2-oxoacid:ferredoxin oxidoreductase subunit gamma [Thermoplasmata archaeon]NIT79800.1 2-oxoacid:ferredoxin oxidoreductase subunit gamma [Thermoplasmata archaeon]NIV80671.1 2-oxoacid:ferredoxin oxidoreductase subunit gamma [Thermoplasmata archaeon]
MRVRFCGFGGQGIVLAGYITGNAAVTDGKNAIQNQSYGSESRGGHCKSDVIVEDGEIFELELDDIDVLVAMSQSAHDMYIDQLEPTGIVIVDSDLVQPREDQVNLHAVPFTDIAYQAFNRKIMGNMVMLGYLVGATGVVSEGSMRKAIEANVPKGTEEMNIKAYK